ncbi:hypothetical protein EVAR_53417_1 [Eumeta japonica]|uniref:Uncharacterized protein n=1 Tax=Eumeta variegata TaxID=151549 RepID=A0A4C1XT48_EUMVA|nr:hypothetical protein EVAR_53417_1 [Eumeta japonica]
MCCGQLYGNGPGQLDGASTSFTKYLHIVTASDVAFRTATESSCGSPSLHHPASTSNGYPIPIQEAVNTLVTPLGLSMDGSDHLLSARMFICPSNIL